MATLLHHIQPWMQRSIAEAEERLERRMVQHPEGKIVEVHQRLDAFELWVLAWPAPQVDPSGCSRQSSRIHRYDLRG